MNPYHYALLRYVHHPAAAEFANIGVVMWLPQSRELLHKVSEKYGRLSHFFGGFEGSGYRNLLKELQRRLGQLAEAGGQNTLDEGLARLIPLDSSCFRHSEIMGGISPDPRRRLDELYQEFVARPDVGRSRRDEAAISLRIDTVLAAHALDKRVMRQVKVRSSRLEHVFRVGWMNGKQQVMEPIALDYTRADEILDKASTWTGRLVHLEAPARFSLTGVVSAPPEGSGELQKAFDLAVQLLSATPGVRRVVLEDQLESFMPEIERDLRHESDPSSDAE